jgi:hypothetical protein
MDAIIAEWLKNPSSIGRDVLLMVAVYALLKGWLVPKWVHDGKIADCAKMEKSRDELLEMLLHTQQATVRAVNVLTPEPPKS